MKRVFLTGAALLLAICGLIFLTTGNLFGREFNGLFPEEPVSVGPEGLPLSGKTIVCMGDSILGMNRTGTSVTAFLAEKTGATVYNAGFGGTRLAVHQREGYAAFSGWTMAEAAVKGDWSRQEGEAALGSSYFPAQLENLKAIDFSGVDILILHYGANDFTADIPLDREKDPVDVGTLCGALRHTLKAWREAFPELEIWISLPLYRYWPDEDAYAEDYRNGLGLTLADYVQALYQTVREEGASVIDGYEAMGMDRKNVKWMTLDGVHLSRAGRKRLAQVMGECLLAAQ